MQETYGVKTKDQEGWLRRARVDLKPHLEARPICLVPVRCGTLQKKKMHLPTILTSFSNVTSLNASSGRRHRMCSSTFRCTIGVRKVRPACRLRERRVLTLHMRRGAYNCCGLCGVRDTLLDIRGAQAHLVVPAHVGTIVPLGC